MEVLWNQYVKGSTLFAYRVFQLSALTSVPDAHLPIVKRACNASISQDLASGTLNFGLLKNRAFAYGRFV